MTLWEGAWGQATDLLGSAGQLEWGGVSQWGKPVCFVQLSPFRQVQDTFMELFLAPASSSHQVPPVPPRWGPQGPMVGVCGMAPTVACGHPASFAQGDVPQLKSLFL